MRRPAQTREQKKHAREQRALLTLRRSAVRYSMLGDDQEGSPHQLALAFADLTAAADRYRESLTVREQRKLAGKMPAITREAIESAIDDLGAAHRRDAAGGDK
jgi:hypothetical protein